MKTPVSLILLLAAAVAHADVPRKPSPTQYSHLWNNSPFTVKPPPPPPPEKISEFDDWVVTGLSGEPDGSYTVFLQHKKNADETQVIGPSGTLKYTAEDIFSYAPGDSKAFKVDSVEFKDTYLETVVHLSGGGRTGTVKFDEKSSVPKASAPPKNVPHPGMNPNPGNPGANPAPNPGGTPGNPTPRPRLPQPGNRNR